MYYDQEKKICACNKKYYLDGKDCKKCNNLCEKCSNDSLCESCYPESNIEFKDQKCQCKDGFYQQDQQCVQCPKSCKKCQKQNSDIICEECQPNFQKDSQNQCNCNDGYYLDEFQNIQKCPSSCKTCKLGLKKKIVCLECNYGNKECQCEQGKYDDGHSCQTCPNKCKGECYKSGVYIICNECVKDNNNRNNDKICSCKDGYFEDHDNCKQCDKKPCDIKGHKLECNTNISQNCNKCNKQKDKCEECKPFTYLDKGICLTKCLDNQYQDEQDRKCISCNKHCIQCSKDPSKCKQCEVGFVLDQDDVCQSNCLKGYYKDENNKCQPCSNNCKKCENSQKCNECVDVNDLLFNNQCINKCPENTYQSQNQCLPCHQSSCKQCSDKNPKICEECFDDFFENLGICQTKCNEGQQEIYELKKCSICTALNCQKCENSSDQCSSCSSKYELVEKDCLPKCKSYEERDDNGICKEKVGFKKNSFILKEIQKNQIQIIFKYDLQNIKNINELLYISIPQLQDSIQSKIDKIDNKIFNVTLTTDKKIDQKYFVLVALKSDLIDQGFENEQSTIEIQIESSPQENEKSGASQKLSSATKAIATATLTALFPLILSGNFWMISSILDISQIIYMSSFINFKGNISLEEFLSSQKDFQIPFTNYFQYIDHYDEINYQTTSKIYEKGIQGFLLSNLGKQLIHIIKCDTISLLLTIQFVKMLLQILLLISSKFDKPKKIFTYLLQKLFPTTLYFDLLWSIYQEICFSVVIQFSTLTPAQYPVEKLNYFVFSICTFGVMLPIYLLYLIYSKKYNHIFEHLTHNLNFKYYQIMLYVRKLFYTIIIGSLYQSSNMQLTFIICFHLFYVIMIYLNKPYNSKFYNFKEGLQSLFFVLSHILIMVIKNKKENQTDQIYSLSWGVISIFTLVMVLEVLVSLREAYHGIKKFYIKYKNKRNKQVSIIPINNNTKIDSDNQQNNEGQINAKQQDMDSNKIFIEADIQQQANQDSPDKFINSSPYKFDSKTQFSGILHEKNGSNVNLRLESPNLSKRISRRSRKSTNFEGNSQIFDNYNVGSMIRFSLQQTQINSETLLDGLTNRDQQQQQTQRSQKIIASEIIEDKTPTSHTTFDHVDSRLMTFQDSDKKQKKNTIKQTKQKK